MIFSEYFFRQFFIFLNTVHKGKNSFPHNSGKIWFFKKSSEKKYFLFKFTLEIFEEYFFSILNFLQNEGFPYTGNLLGSAIAFTRFFQSKICDGNIKYKIFPEMAFSLRQNKKKAVLKQYITQKTFVNRGKQIMLGKRLVLKKIQNSKKNIPQRFLV